MARISERMLALGTAPSEIRDAFTFARQRAAVVGADKVDDFSIGNPSVPAPDSVADAVRALLTEQDPVQLHGYTPAQGDAGVRQTLAEDLNTRFGTKYSGDALYLTCGAAGALCCALSALACPGDEFVVIAPYFPEYAVFIGSAGGTLVEVPARQADFQPDLTALAATLNERTKAVLINSPNNPTGAVYSPETLEALAALLRERSEQYGHPIWLLSDEPYREIYYGDGQLPWVPSYYADTLVCYSYSKSLSLPGERLGWVLTPDAAADAPLVRAAVAGAGRALGYVCAPSLFQFVAARCVGATADISIYRRNRDLLLGALRRYGYTCAPADGAFYLFPETPEPDARAFCQRARALDLVLVPGDSFGGPGHVRISYCVPTEQIERSLWKFEKLMQSYR